MNKLVIPITLDDIKEDKIKYIVSKLEGIDYPTTKHLYEFKQNFFNKHGSFVLLTIDPNLSLKSHSFKLDEIKDIETSGEIVSPSTILLKTPPSGPKKNYENLEGSSYFKKAYSNISPLNSESIEESITQDINDVKKPMYQDNTKNMMFKLVCNNQPFKNCSLKKYGKGYLLIPSTNHPDWGIKYYDNGVGETGWWMNKNNAWFFKKQYIKPILAGGAELVDIK
jgi:hypothetical protein